jgi:hypothetical protein
MKLAVYSLYGFFCVREFIFMTRASTRASFLFNGIELGGPRARCRSRHRRPAPEQCYHGGVPPETTRQREVAGLHTNMVVYYQPGS